MLKWAHIPNVKALGVNMAASGSQVEAFQKAEHAVCGSLQDHSGSIQAVTRAAIWTGKRWRAGSATSACWQRQRICCVACCTARYACWLLVTSIVCRQA